MITALLLFAAQAIDQPKPIDPVTWISSNDFPFEALKDEVGGKVEYEVSVDASGNPADCRIQATSGHAVLDQATCSLIIRRARFEPAKDANGRPVPGTYKGKVTWQRPDWSSQTYLATILDFSADRKHPACMLKREGELNDEHYSCASMLGQQDLLEQLGKRYLQVTFLSVSASGNTTPFRGEPGWGDRLSLIANDQYYRVGGSYPFACVSIAAEGWDAGRDACGGFPGARTLGENEKATSRQSRSEISVFGVAR
jgi:protein TonB